MNRKFKLTLAALLGFSAACSTVKNAPVRSRGDEPGQQADSQPGDTVKVPPRVVLMYGVPMPKTPRDAKPLTEMDEQLDPVAEKPVEDTPYMDTKKAREGHEAPEAGKPARK